MSGAEAIVAVGLMSNIVQFVDFAAKLCSRIREYSSTLGLPSKLVEQSDRLSDILNILNSLETASIAGSPDGSILQRCQTQAEMLSVQLERFKGDGRNRLRNVRLAFKLLRRDQQLQELQHGLDGLVFPTHAIPESFCALISGIIRQDVSLAAGTMANYKQDLGSRLWQRTLLSIIKRQSEHSAHLADLHNLADSELQHSGTVNNSEKPVWMVPIGRNPGFVGREPIIAEIPSRLVPQPDVVQTGVLYSFGGVGKSQITLKYAYRTRERQTDLCVFWVHAGNTAQFIESYQRIATECSIPGLEQADMDTLQLVRNWLETRCEYHWLLIVDNVDDRAMFFDSLTPLGKPLQEYIPQNPRGSLLYTTRNRDLGMDLSLDRDPINVSPMEIDEAQALLGEKARSNSTKEEQLELLNELHFLPLAISQAAAFMAKRRKTVAQYLETYRESESMRVRLLDQRSTHHGRGIKPPESVLTTWRISFEFIKSERPEAAELLSFVSFLDRQRIPASLLILDHQDRFDFEEAIGLLEAFSLIKSDAAGSAYNVHSLVSVAVQRWLTECKQRYDRFAGCALKAVTSKFPNKPSYVREWPTCSAYLPHAEAVLRASATLRHNSEITNRALLSLYVSKYVQSQGTYKHSELLAKESVKLYEYLYGREHPTTLDSIAHYANSMFSRGRYEDATRLFREARPCSISVNTKKLEIFFNLYEVSELLDQDPENPELEAAAFRSKSLVADHLFQQCHWKQAERSYRKLIEIEPIHINRSILWGLAVALLNQDRYDEAESLLIEQRRHYIEDFGDKHPYTLAVIDALAHIADGQGKYDEAGKNRSHVYTTLKASLGDDHPSTLLALAGLGMSVCRQGRHSEAEIIAKSCLTSSESLFGPRHPYMLECRNVVSWILKSGGKYEEALQMDIGSLDIAKNLECESTSSQLGFLWDIIPELAYQNRWEETEAFRHQELGIQLSLSDDDDPDPQRSLVELAKVMLIQGKCEAALLMSQEALQTKSRTPKWEHEAKSLAIWIAAQENYRLGNFDVAEEKFQELVDMKLKISETEDVMALNYLSWLADAQYRQRKYAESEANYRREWAIRTTKSGSGDMTTLRAKRNVAFLLGAQNDVSEEAASLLRQVVQTSKRVFGLEYEETQFTLSMLAHHLTRMRNLEEADVYRGQIITTPSSSSNSQDDTTG